MSAPRIVSATTTSGRGRGGRMFTHAVMLDASGRKLMVLCERVRLSNIGSDYGQRPVDCPRCLRALRETPLGASA